MRDPNRIPEVMGLLLKVWLKYPDWRLGQIVVNAGDRNDPFYVEDDEMLKGLQALLEKE